MAGTIRYECSSCGFGIKDTPVERRWIENHGKFVPLNTNASRSRVSYTWNALLPHWVGWRSAVEEFLAAMDAMRTGGEIEAMFMFVTGTLGEAWDTDRWLVVLNCIVDSGFKASEVYRFCQATGWKPMKGDNAEWFLYQDPKTEKTVRRPWRKVLVDPSIGAKASAAKRHLMLYQWSNPTVKDHLALFTHGVVGQWTVPGTTGRDYFDQLAAEVRENREDSRGRVKTIWV